MFSISVIIGKTFAAEQTIRELKTGISKLNSQKLKISPKKVEISTANMNIHPCKKYGFSPKEVESRALRSERFRTLYNIHRIEKTDKLNQRQDRYDQKNTQNNEKKLRENKNTDKNKKVNYNKIKRSNNGQCQIMIKSWSRLS